MKNRETAIIAGGCFWGMEGLFQRKDGIIDTQVGYTGGHTDNPKYEQVRTGTTGHSESLQIIFDSTIISYRQILLFFFQIHNPTTLNKQGNDMGNQYRSAIFYTSDKQKEIALQTIKDVEEYDYWQGKIVTSIEPATTFWEAEDYHQDYLLHKPDGYTCHFPRNDWILTK